MPWLIAEIMYAGTTVLAFAFIFDLLFTWTLLINHDSRLNFLLPDRNRVSPVLQISNDESDKSYPYIPYRNGAGPAAMYS